MAGSGACQYCVRSPRVPLRGDAAYGSACNGLATADGEAEEGEMKQRLEWKRMTQTGGKRCLLINEGRSGMESVRGRNRV